MKKKITPFRVWLAAWMLAGAVGGWMFGLYCPGDNNPEFCAPAGAISGAMLAGALSACLWRPFWNRRDSALPETTRAPGRLP